MSRPAEIDALHDLILGPADTGLPARAAGTTVRDFLASAPDLAEFWTPLFALDAAALAHNARTIQTWCDERGLELMPHGKTSMAPALWQQQLDAGAHGITFATIGQVRTARSFGIDRIMLANALVDPRGIAYLAGEFARGLQRFSCWADSLETVEALERALADADADADAQHPIDVLVELGAPGGRTGARTQTDALAIAERVVASPTLRLAGVAGYEGCLGHDRSPTAETAVREYLERLLELANLVRPLADADGSPDFIVTAGGSAYLDLVADVFAPAIARSRHPLGEAPTRFVLRSGASLLHDNGFYRGISPIDDLLEPAMRAYARVVSHPEPALALLDGGKRDLPYDEGLPVVLAASDDLGATERPIAAEITAMNDQHSFLRSTDDTALPVAIGDVMRLGLSHPCTAFDKRRWVPVVAGNGNDTVIDLVRTAF